MFENEPINKNDLKKLLEMSDDEIRRKLQRVLEAQHGASPLRTLSLSSEDLAKIRKAASSLDDADIRRLMAGVPPEKIAEIKAQLGINEKR